MQDELVTRSFHLSEFIESDTATRLRMDNTPPPPILATLRGVLIPGMQAVRDMLGHPIIIKSGYRSPRVNSAIGGSSSSQHMSGQAADFVCPGFGAPKDIAKLLVSRMSTLKFDQLIYEGAWVHISFSSRPRNQVLTAHFGNGSVSYTPGLA